MTSWHVARLVERRPETASARTLVFDVPGWPGHLPGQHADIRLTAEDGYQAVRSYSLSAPADGSRIEVSIQPDPDGEVSPYLAEELPEGAEIQLRGPLGGWFVWREETTDPVLLVAGGSGIAPLMAMLRARVRQQGTGTPRFHLLYALRAAAERWYGDELDGVAKTDGIAVTYLYSREAPAGSSRPAGRLRDADLSVPGFAAVDDPLCFVCGPTGFVEHASELLVARGHRPEQIRTERFG